MRVIAQTLVLFLLLSMFGGLSPALAAPPDGTLAIGVHVTLVSRWLDPGETEALITPFMVLYALHDAPRTASPTSSCSARTPSSTTAIRSPRRT